MQFHLTIELGDAVLHHQAEQCAAEAFAQAAHKQHITRVTIDDQVTRVLKPLPCERL